MGSLVRVPQSEVNATLEVLERAGVTEEGLRRIRGNPFYARRVAEAFRKEGFLPTRHLVDFSTTGDPRFPVQNGITIVDVVVFRPSTEGETTTSQVLRHFAQLGLRTLNGQEWEGVHRNSSLVETDTVILMETEKPLDKTYHIYPCGGGKKVLVQLTDIKESRWRPGTVFLAAPRSDMSEWQKRLLACRQDSISEEITEACLPLGTRLSGQVVGFCFGTAIVGLAAGISLKRDFGLTPVGFGQAMEYVASHPDLQLDRPVVALGAEVKVGVHTRVPVFCPGPAGRHLTLSTIYFSKDADVYPAETIFLAVKTPVAEEAGK